MQRITEIWPQTHFLLVKYCYTLHICSSFSFYPFTYTSYLIHICLLCHVKKISFTMKTWTSNICMFCHNLTLIYSTWQLGKADLLSQFLHVATYSILKSAIDYTGKIVTKILATDAYPLWAALSLNEPQRHAGARGKPSCEGKWKKRWCKNYKWYFYTCSFITLH